MSYCSVASTTCSTSCSDFTNVFDCGTKTGCQWCSNVGLCTNKTVSCAESCAEFNGGNSVPAKMQMCLSAINCQYCGVVGACVDKDSINGCPTTCYQATSADLCQPNGTGLCAWCNLNSSVSYCYRSALDSCVSTACEDVSAAVCAQLRSPSLTVPSSVTCQWCPAVQVCTSTSTARTVP